MSHTHSLSPLFFSSLISFCNALFLSVYTYMCKLMSALIAVNVKESMLIKLSVSVCISYLALHSFNPHYFIVFPYVSHPFEHFTSIDDYPFQSPFGIFVFFQLLSTLGMMTSYLLRFLSLSLSLFEHVCVCVSRLSVRVSLCACVCVCVPVSLSYLHHI